MKATATGGRALRGAAAAILGAALACGTGGPGPADGGPDAADGGGEHADTDGGARDGGFDGGGQDGGLDGGAPRQPGSVCQMSGPPCGSPLSCYLVSPSSLQGFCARSCASEACPAGSRCSGGAHPYCAVDCTGSVQCPAGSLCYPGNPGMCMPDCRLATGFCGSYDCQSDGTCRFY